MKHSREAEERSRCSVLNPILGGGGGGGLIMQRKIIIRCSYAFQTGPIKNKTLPSAKC